MTIYTDGACFGNPGKGGYGYILRYKTHYKEGFGGFLLTTNNRMELIAVIRALGCVRRPMDISLYTDSLYIRNAIEEGWLAKWQRSAWKRSSKQAVKNKDLWELLLPSLSTHNIEFIWVKAHNGDIDNERCDALAKQGASMEMQEHDTIFESTI